MKKLIIGILFSTLCISMVAPTALAAYGLPDEYQPDNIAESRDLDENTEAYGATAVNYILADLVSGLLGLVGVIAVFFLVSNSLKYVTSFGQQDKIDQAKKGIFWSLGGLLIILISYSAVRFVIRVILEVDVDEETATEATEAAEDATSWLMNYLA